MGVFCFVFLQTLPSHLEAWILAHPAFPIQLPALPLHPPEAESASPNCPGGQHLTTATLCLSLPLPHASTQGQRITSCLHQQEC